MATVVEKDMEKVDMIEISNKYGRLGISEEDAIFYEEFGASDRHKKMLWKVDIRLVPTLALLYLCAHIDRANIGNAKIEGLVEDLGMTGVQYNIVLSIFFIPYILLEVPSNILLKKFKRPSTYLGMLVVAWGLIMTFTGLVKNFSGLMACRILLGVAEAGFFPGAVYLISAWYQAKQLQLRIALFYCASALSGAFSGLLAFAIAKMDGLGNLPGWAWIFILEGAVTVLIGFATFFIMPDTPELSGKWLDQDEIKWLTIRRITKEGGKSNAQGEVAEKVKWKLFREIVTDYKVWLQAYILFTASVCACGLKFMMPSITKSMGYSSSQAQLLTIPPYVAGAISALVMSYFSDRVGWRMPFVVGPMSIITLGFCILTPLAPNIVNQIPACYIGVMLVCIGQYPTNPAGSARIAGNLANDMKRSMGLAFNICVGNCGAILGSYVFLDSQKSKGYPLGFGMGLALAASTIFTTLFLEYSYWRINKQKAAIPEHEIRAQYSDDELANMGDQSPLFRHKL